jgi:hypothetical protein
MIAKSFEVNILLYWENISQLISNFDVFLRRKKLTINMIDMIRDYWILGKKLFREITITMRNLFLSLLWKEYNYSFLNRR